MGVLSAALVPPLTPGKIADLDAFNTQVLDPALLRPGRLDRCVVVPLPDEAGRREILKVHAARVRLAPGVSLERVAARADGFSGADLAGLVRSAASFALERYVDAALLAGWSPGEARRSAAYQPTAAQPRPW